MDKLAIEREPVETQGSSDPAQRAADRTRQASNAAYISAGLTTAGALLGFFIQSSDPRLIDIVSPAALVDAVLLAFLAFMIRRHSFVAAVVLFGYWILAKLAQVLSTGQISALVLGAVFAYFFFHGMLGAWYFRQNTAPEDRSRNEIFGWVAGALLMLVMVLGLILPEA